MSLNRTYVTHVSLGIDNNEDTVITSISGSSTQLTATSFLTGPPGASGAEGLKGDRGDTGPIGDPGPPNSLSIGTVTSGGAGAHIGGTPPAQTLDLTLPTGVSATMTVEGVVSRAYIIAMAVAL